MRQPDQRPTAADFPLLPADELLKFQQSWDRLQELKAEGNAFMNLIMPKEHARFDPQVDHAYRLNISPGNPNNCKLHVRAIVDTDQIVVAVHSKRRGWQYRIEHRASLHRWFNEGRLTKAI